MSESQVVLVVAAFAILAIAVLIASRQWLQPGVFSAIVYAIAGAAIILLLWRARVTLDWFHGGTWGFIIGFTLFASAFAGRTASERSFRLPFLGAMGLTMLAVNVVAHL